MSATQIRRVDSLTSERFPTSQELASTNSNEDRELERLTEISVRAFKHVLAARALVGGNDSLIPPQFRALIRAADLEGSLYVLENPQGDILSFAAWFPPGKQLYASQEQRELGFDEMMQGIDQETREWHIDTYKATMGSWSKLWLPQSILDCWWLNALATDPDHQQKGYATQLMKHALNMIPENDLIAFCSTTAEAAAFYEQSGVPVRCRLAPDMPSRVGPIPIIGHYTNGLATIPVNKD